MTESWNGRAASPSEVCAFNRGGTEEVVAAAKCEVVPGVTACFSSPKDRRNRDMDAKSQYVFACLRACVLACLRACVRVWVCVDVWMRNWGTPRCI
jgi:hypothetical protein